MEKGKNLRREFWCARIWFVRYMCRAEMNPEVERKPTERVKGRNCWTKSSEGTQRNEEKLWKKPACR